MKSLEDYSLYAAILNYKMRGMKFSKDKIIKSKFTNGKKGFCDVEHVGVVLREMNE